MALQSSGTIKLSEIQAEFGGSNPIKMSEYYSAAAGVPSSGTLKMSDFYGKSSYVPFGQKVFLTPAGWANWTVPSNVSSICILCIGAGGAGGSSLFGGGGGGGGSLTYINNVSVTPGSTLKVQVGKAGQCTGRARGGDGQSSEVRVSSSSGTILCKANGGRGGGGGGGDSVKAGGRGGDASTDWTIPTGATRVSTWGCAGGDSYKDWSGGGGGGPPWSTSGASKAGYGGYVALVNGKETMYNGQNGKNGGGGGGGYFKNNLDTSGGRNGMSGGGTGYIKDNTVGIGGGNQQHGTGGSGGATGNRNNGGGFGAGGGGNGQDGEQNNPVGADGGVGVVRIIWGTGISLP